MIKIYKDKKKNKLIKVSLKLLLSNLKQILGTEYKNTYFIDSSGFKISNNDENKITIEDIVSNNEIFTITEEKKKIIIDYNNKEHSKIDFLPNITLKELKKKFPNEIPSEAIFIYEEGFEILKDDEESFKVEDIIKNDKIFLKDSK